jgi:hypothetical protein
MKRFSEKAFIKTGIIDKLNSKTFIKDNNEYLFYMWDYEKNKYLFVFRKKEDINKSLYEPCKTFNIQLYLQHLNNYENTFNLICKCFDKIENIQE